MTIRLFYPGGRFETVEAGIGNDDFAVTAVTGADSVHAVTVTPKKEGLALLAVEAELPLPADLLVNPENILVYQNAAYTNDVTSVIPFTPDTPMSTYELYVLKNIPTGRVCLCGYVTYLRFWSKVTVRDGAVIFRSEFEERTLNAGEAYTMERFTVTDGTNCENRLLEAYGDAVAKYMNAIPTGEVPTGWCSWSCYYADVNEEKIRRAVDAQVRYTKPGQANVVQIDDGWEYSNSFPGDFITDESKFPEGMAATAKYVTDRGMTFGLWLAPFLVADTSVFYDRVKDFTRTNDVTLGDNLHPFEIGDPRFLEHLRKNFTRMTKEYGAHYFKLDFLAAGIRYFNGSGPQETVRFRDGFCIELLRNALKVIRETVGDDAFMVSCGANLLMGVGIFNCARMSCDIIWGKNPAYPTYWQIIKNCLATVSWRYFMHRRAFINDPDGLVLRDVEQGDGYNSTWSEAQLWSIAIAMSGGSVLSNDELENLSPARRSLYTRLLPPLDVACHPVDYFEQPAPTAYVIDYAEGVKLLSLYNFDDVMKTVEFDLAKIGMAGALAVDCMTDKVVGISDKLTVTNLNPHGGAMFLLRMPADKPAFAFADCDVWGGIHRVTAEFDGENADVRAPEDAKVYALCPEGKTVKGETVWSGSGYAVVRIK